MERRAGSTTSASLQLWVPCWTFLCHRRTEQEHPATKCWSAVSTASGLSLHRPNALWSWHSHRSLLEAPQSCSFKMKLQTSDLVVVNASFSHGAKTCLVINARPKVQPVSEICFCSLAPLWSSAPFPAKCEWPQAAPPSVGTLRARLSPSLPGLSSTPDTHMQAGSQHGYAVLWAPPALWYSHRQRVWVRLAYGCGVILDPTAGCGGTDAQSSVIDSKHLPPKASRRKQMSNITA